MNLTGNLFNELAEHLEAMARTLRRHAAQGASTGVGPAAAVDAEAQEHVDAVMRRAWVAHPQMGERQEQILREVALAQPRGTTVGEVARKIGYEQPNTSLTLAALVRHGLVRKDADARPQRYYLGPELAGAAHAS